MIYSKINKTHMKKINANIVLDAVRKAGEISRKELVERIGLTAGTITNIVNECIESNLLFESGSGISLGGRKPVYIELNPNAGYVFGLELNVNKIECVLANFKAEIMDFITEDAQVSEGPEFIVDQIARIFETLKSRNKIHQDKIIGIGIVSSGPLDREQGIMFYPPNFKGWGIVNIKKMVEDKTGITTVFENDTSGAALGEYWFGKLNYSRNIFYLLANHTGIGGGMVIDGDIFHGYKDNAADIGHIIVDIHGAKCTCGKSGCLEAMVNGSTAINRYNQQTKVKEKLNPDSYHDLMKLIKKAEAGDALCTQIMEDFAFYLNVGLITVIQIFSPDAILLGGEFFNNSTLLFDKTIAHLKNLTYPPFVKDIPILRSSFLEKSGAVGGVAIVFNSLKDV